MLKNILKIKEVKSISSNELKSIQGGDSVPSMCYCEALGFSVECNRYDQVCPLES